MDEKDDDIIEDDDPEEDEENKDPVMEYEGLDSKYVIYIVFALTAVMVILVFISSMNPITFAVYDPEKTDYYLNNLDEAKSKYNSESDRLPSLFLSVFGDERIDATLVRINGEKVALAVTTESGRISNIQKGNMQDPTMQLEISESTIKRISESENAVDELETALDNEEIKYETVRLKSTVKMAIVEAAVQVWSWFS